MTWEKSMTNSEMSEYATAVFEALVGENQDRLQRGLILRQAMHDSVKRGETPTGYRSPWIKAAAVGLAKHLGEVAKAFDAEHPQDKASVSDILDILATAEGLFRRK